MSNSVELDDLDLSSIPVVEPQNPQLYPNSSLSGSDLEAHLVNRDDNLFGARKPNFAITHEKPEHRVILALKLEGYSNREIAKRLGYTDSWVSQVTRQPWFQARLLNELKTRTAEGYFQDFIKIQAEQSLLTLCELRDTALSENVRATCAMNIVDRYLGKPVQKSEVKMEVHKTEKRVLDIDEELKMLEEEEKRLNAQAITVESPK